MRVVIVGGGAVGLLFAARLARSSFAGSLVVVTSKAASLSSGYVNVRATSEQAEQAWHARKVHVHLKFVESAQQAVQALGGFADVVLIALKSHALGLPIHQRGFRELLGPDRPESGVAVCLANGLGNLERVGQSVGPDRAAAGVTYHGCQLVMNDMDGRLEVLHNGTGHTFLGAALSQRARLEELAEYFGNQDGGRGLFNVTVLDQALAMDQVWKKFLVNCSVNSVAALFRLTNGEYATDARATVLRKGVLEEALALRKAMVSECAFEMEELDSLVLDVAAKTAANRNSMLQDLDSGRRTEIQALNGYVVEKSAQLGLCHAACNAALTTLIQRLERP